MSDENGTPKPLEPQHSTEAPCSANVRARIGGYDWQITCRSHVDKDDLLNMAKAIKWWNTWLDGNAAQNVKAAEDAINIEHPKVTATTPPPPTTPKPTTGAQTSQVNTFHIVKMEVEPRSDGKVNLKFFEDGHKWPDLTATKAPGDAAVMLQPIGGWLPEHFAQAATYEIAARIEWVNSDKLNSKGNPYKNIVAVKPANV